MMENQEVYFGHIKFEVLTRQQVGMSSLQLHLYLEFPDVILGMISTTNRT